MTSSNPAEVEELLGKARLLTSEQRDILINQLMRERYWEGRKPDAIRETPHGPAPEYWTRPEERRYTKKSHFDLFMGEIAFSYNPPPKRDYIRQVLVSDSGIGEKYFRPFDTDGFGGNCNVRPMNEKHLLEIANKKGLSLRGFTAYLSDFIENLTDKIFWKLPDYYLDALHKAEADLEFSIAAQVNKAMGINLSSAFSDGHNRIVREIQQGSVTRKIERGRGQPKGSKIDPDELKGILRVILAQEFSEGRTPEKITIEYLCQYFTTPIYVATKAGLEKRLSRAGIQWEQFRNSIWEDFNADNKSGLFDG